MLLLFDTVQLTIFSYFYCYPIALYYDCQEADQLAIYTAQLRSSTWGRGLTPKTTRLQVQHPNHSATQPPGSLFEFTWQFLEKNVLVYLQALHHQLKTSFLNKQRTSARCLICKCQKELFFYLDSSWKEPYSWFAELGKGSLYCILGKGTEL